MPTGQSSNAIEFTFEGNNSIPDNATLEAIALANGAVEEGDSPVEATPAETKDDTPETTEQVADQPVVDPQVFKITVDGQELLVTQKDLLDGHMRNRDYTQKTQRLAAREREISAKEQQYQSELSTIDQFLKDPHALRAYYDKAFGTAAPPQQAYDPNQPINAQTAATIAAQQAGRERQALEASMRTQLEAIRQEARESVTALKREKVESVIEGHMNGLLNKYPVLRKFDDIEEVLMADAQKGGPVTSIEDAKARLASAAENRATIIRAIAEEEKKSSAIKAATLKKNSPEPVGGRGIKASTSGKPLTMDHKDTRQRIDAGVELIRGFLD